MKTPKKARKIREITVLVIFDGTHRVLVKNSRKGLLSRLYGYPVLPGRVSREEAEKAVREMGFSVTETVPLPERKHVFTHVEWQMAAWFVRVLPEIPVLPEEYILADGKAIETEYALPRAFRRWDDELKELSQE